MIRDYQFIPGVGALPVTFEMSPGEVEAAIGPPDAVGTNYLGEREEDRGPTKVHYSLGDTKVAEIGFLPQVHVAFEGVDLFRRPDPIQLLAQRADPFECLGVIVFPKLGISLSGFHDRDESQKAITVFRPGRWDEFRDHMVPWNP